MPNRTFLRFEATWPVAGECRCIEGDVMDGGWYFFAHSSHMLESPIARNITVAAVDSPRMAEGGAAAKAGNVVTGRDSC